MDGHGAEERDRNVEGETKAYFHSQGGRCLFLNL